MKCVFSPDAQADLAAIWDDTFLDWGIDQAETQLQQIRNSVSIVANNPLVGRDCSEIRPRYRKYPAGSDMLFYSLADDTVTVVRILHQRLDHGRHF
jgi:toxin ParE1/3/4